MTALELVGWVAWAYICHNVGYVIGVWWFTRRSS